MSGCIQIGPSDDMSDPNETPPPFAGTWLYNDTAFSCVHSLIFFKREGRDAYEIDLGCSLSQGGVGVQVEAGEYTVGEDGETMFVPTQATCTSGRVVSHSQTVEQPSDTLLRVTDNDGPKIYERASSTGLLCQ
jgi:hypothetical protein